MPKKNCIKRTNKSKKMKQKCIDYTILLKYIEKRASDKERGMVEAHIADCNHCLGVFARMNRIQNDTELNAWLDIPVSDDLAHSVIKQIDSKKMRNRIVQKVNSMKYWFQTICLRWMKPLFARHHLQPVPVRASQKETNMLNHSFKKRILTIVYETNDQNQARLNIQLRPLSDNNLRVFLLDNKGNNLASRFIEKDRPVFFNNVNTGQYEMRIMKQSDNTEETRISFIINLDGIHAM
jgi:hypothetical protein